MARLPDQGGRVILSLVEQDLAQQPNHLEVARQEGLKHQPLHARGLEVGNTCARLVRRAR